MTNGKVFVVIPAAGAGRRMGSSVPKQYLELTESGQTVLAKSIEVIFQSVRVENAIIAVATAIIAFSTRTLWKITSILLAKTVCPLSVNSRYCFGTEDPILRPAPAAGITTKTLPLVIIYFQVRSS